MTANRPDTPAEALARKALKPLGALVVGVFVLIGFASCYGGSGTPAPTVAVTAAPASTPTSAASWTGKTLDGRTVTIYDDGGKTSFTGSVPSPIDVIDNAKTCADLAGEYKLWRQSKAGTPAGVDRMSAYANHALAVAKARGCKIA